MMTLVDHAQKLFNDDALANMFAQVFEMNKYTRWYLALMIKARTIPVDDNYREQHHVLPKSIAPDFRSFYWFPTNKALLTAREHFVAHWLLTKMCRKGSNEQLKMSQALSCMANRRNTSIKLTSRQLERAKLERRAAKGLWRVRTDKPKRVGPMLGKKHHTRYHMNITNNPMNDPAVREKARASRQRMYDEGWRISPEARKKISEFHKGKPKSEAHREKMRGRVMPEETRRKISASKMGHVVSEEQKAKMRATIARKKALKAATQ